MTSNETRTGRCGAGVGVTAPLAVLLGLGLAAPAAAQKLGEAVQGSTRTNTESAASQRRIEKLDDEKDDLLRQYRTELKQIESLRIYNGQLEELLAAQDAERQSLQEQIDRVTMVGREVTPLMLKMIEALEEFVRLDVPFLQDERQTRLEELRAMMARSDVADSEKYRRILEAYQVENEYGRTIEAYKGEIELDGQPLLVDFLRFGRLALLYQTQDGSRSGRWDMQVSGWTDLPSSYRTPIREGLRIAKKQKAPNLIALPVAAPEVTR